MPGSTPSCKQLFRHREAKEGAGSEPGVTYLQLAASAQSAGMKCLTPRSHTDFGTLNNIPLR